MSDWQKSMTDAIGREVLRLRGDRSALWLSNRTEELGFKVSRSGISPLETGKRQSISVAEWLILAAALEVPPLQLLFPYYPTGEGEVLPGLNEETYKAGKWFVGDVEYKNGRLTTTQNERKALADVAFRQPVEVLRHAEALATFKDLEKPQFDHDRLVKLLEAETNAYQELNSIVTGDHAADLVDDDDY